MTEINKNAEKDKKLYDFIKQRDSSDTVTHKIGDCGLKYKDTKVYLKPKINRDDPMTVAVGFLNETIYETTNEEVISTLVNKWLAINSDEKEEQRYKDSQFDALITNELLTGRGEQE